MPPLPPTLSPSQILSAGGPIARHLGPAYEPRPQQLQMAEAVADALNDKDGSGGVGGHLLVEAGTGVGKSYAYLVPAILRCLLHNERIVIATNTIALQEQLITRDIPLLQQTLHEWGIAPHPPNGAAAVREREDPPNGTATVREREHHAPTPDSPHGTSSPAEAPPDTRNPKQRPQALGHRPQFQTPDPKPQTPDPASPPVSLLGGRCLADSLPALRPVLVKGRGNYLSIRRLQLASKRQLAIFPDAASRASLHAIEDWAYDTDDGTLSTLPPLERPGIWDRVQSDSANCMGKRCPTYAQCFYQTARRAMEEGNLLICNHALFFSDLALRAKDAGFLPEYHHVILDEAHSAEDVAAEHFGLSLTEGRVNHLLSILFHPRTGKGYLPQLELAIGTGGVAGVGLIDGAIRAVHAAEDAARAFFDHLLALVNEPRASASGYLSADKGIRGQPGGGSLAASTLRLPAPNLIANPLTDAMRALALRLKTLKEHATDIADRFELNAYAERAAAIADTAEALISQSLPGCVYWLEFAGAAEPSGGVWGLGSGVSNGQRDGAASAHDSRTGRGPDPKPQPPDPSRSPRLRLACSPIDVGPLLNEHLFSKPISVTLTSATLATKTRHNGTATVRERACSAQTKDATTGETTPSSPPPSQRTVSRERAEAPFTHTITRLGIPADDRLTTLQLDSPFDYPTQVEFYVDLTLPSPAPSGGGWPSKARPGGGVSGPSSHRHSVTSSLPRPLHPDPYLNALASRILHHIQQTRGGAFVLFTSFATLNAVANALERPLAQQDFPLLAQNRSGPRSYILEQFRANPRSVLFGAASFWQGVDVRGDALRNVIITRLPFDPPDRPLTQARLELIQARGGNPFMEDSLPRAVLRFKQGFGRLIRSKTDTGRVVVLDGRILTARYGRAFLDAIPPGLGARIIDR